ncbi:hypothetical protein SGPA1_60213 [Streptomyces misionensis JCM 4497]
MAWSTATVRLADALLTSLSPVPPDDFRPTGTHASGEPLATC